MSAARRRDPPDLGAGALALLALFKIDDPTPEQEAGALLLACGLADLHAMTSDADT